MRNIIHVSAADVCAQSARQMGPTPSANVRPLLAAAAPGTALADTWIAGTSSSSSRHQQQQQQFVLRSHMAVLSDASGWFFHTGVGLWACVQPGVHELAGQAPRPGGFAAAGRGTDAERMRCSSSAAAQGCGAAGVRPPLPQPREGAWARRQAQLELLKALALGDAAGYERWLRALAHVLAQQRDEVGGCWPLRLFRHSGVWVESVVVVAALRPCDLLQTPQLVHDGGVLVVGQR
jgi:hypothetical protein